MNKLQENLEAFASFMLWIQSNRHDYEQEATENLSLKLIATVEGKFFAMLLRKNGELTLHFHDEVYTLEDCLGEWLDLIHEILHEPMTRDEYEAHEADAYVEGCLV